MAVRPLGIEGDEQADLSVHGGLARRSTPTRASTTPFWQTVRAQARVALWERPLPSGFLGENLTLDGLLETRAWIGDVLRFPGCDSPSASRAFPASSSTP